MDSSKLRVGDVYFVLGRICDPKRSSMISTWVYEGVVQRDSSAATCDVPFHFHRFVEWNSWKHCKHLRERGVEADDIHTGVDVPSLQQACQAVTLEGTVTLRSVGTVEVDGQKCRWIEIDTNAKRSGKPS